MYNKKLPPFGKPLYALLKKDFRPHNDVRLFIGNKAWDKGKGFSISYPNSTLILPPWDNPLSYFWPVTGCNVIIFDTGYAENTYLDDLAFALYQGGADKVRCVTSNYEFFNFEK